VIVATAVVAGLIVVGSPGNERMRRLDKRRVEDLDGIHNALNKYWAKYESLPASLERLQDSPDTTANIRDPLTSQPYAYTIVSAKTYELCAEFQRDSGDIDSGRSDFWSHAAGRRCFRIEAVANRK